MLPEKLLRDAEKAAQRIKMYDHVRVISHHDTDGITSAGIICNALIRSGISFHSTLVSRLDEKLVRTLEEEMVIFCDMGSAQTNLLSKTESEIVIIDHHIPSEIKIKCAHVNPHFSGIDGSFELSASGTAYLVAKCMGNNEDLSGLAITGAIGDKQQMIGVNRDILEEGMKKGVISVTRGIKIGDGNLKEVLELSTEPYLDITGKPEKIEEFLNEIGVGGKVSELDKESMKKLASFIILKLINTSPPDVLESLIGDIYLLNMEVIKNSIDLSRILDACGKLGKTGLALSLTLRDDSWVEEGYETYKTFQRKLISELKDVKERIIEGKGIRYVYANDRDITGALAGTIIRYIYTDKPIVVLNQIDGISKVSARGTRKQISSGLNLSIAMREAADLVGGVGGGHNIASGASIPKGKEEEFVRIVDRIVYEQLRF
ncbi:MAG: DHH family phosphoesterase [Candidatus Syntropharchaeia archaeon]